MTKRNDIAPYERPEARRWTRVTDYVPDAQAHVGNIHWPKPGGLSQVPPTVGRSQRNQHSGLLLPFAAVFLAAMTALWGSGILNGQPEPRATRATTSRGLVFGLCGEGGVRNCVQGGDSFYLGGKTVRIAGIEAPQLYGAACPKESELGRASAVKLQQILNSGELELTRTAQDFDSYGLLLRNVSVDGKSVAQAMVAARLAREIGDSTRSWC